MPKTCNKWEFDIDNEEELKQLGYNRNYENVCITCRRYDKCNKGNQPNG